VETLRALLEANTAHVEAFGTRFGDLQDDQRPAAVTVCCSDSRVLQDHIWDNEDPGRLFTCGNIGNRVVQRTDAGHVVSGDVLYPLVHTGTETVIVVGHTGCGAITATYDSLTDGHAEPPGIQHCVSLLEPYLAEGLSRLPAGLDRSAVINRLVEYNVDRQVSVLVESDSVPPTVNVAGVVYDFQDVYDGRRGEIHVVTIDGERSVDALKTRYPEFAPRIERLWEYDG